MGGRWREVSLVLGSVAVTLALQRLLQHLTGGRRKSSLDFSLVPGRATAVDAVDLKPPFPTKVVQLLRSACLCQLGVTLDDSTAHLCLMNFTYDPAQEIIIMSTRRDTTKYQALVKTTRATLLMHDFPTEKAGRDADKDSPSSMWAKTYSITLYGKVRILDGPAAERCQSLHLERHGEEYRQFIVGSDVAIIAIDVERAKICNVADKVEEWSRADKANN